MPASPQGKRRHHVVVSAENNSYMAWQCKLFHYSCVSRLGVIPVILVHSLERKCHPYFADIIAAGGIVRSAPSFRTTKFGHDYSPRNTPGTLLQASRMGYNRNDFIVLCDPDMIFVRPLTFEHTLASERSASLDYEQKSVQRVARSLGISPKTLEQNLGKIECAVPHVIPVAYAEQFANAWLDAIDAFSPGVWETSMYAFGFAAVKLGLRLKLRSDVALNDEPYEAPGRAKIIHYAYGDDLWNKRHYWESRSAHRVWQPSFDVPQRTILAEIVKQIREARAFYAKAV
jgi:hypothetical protein